MTIPSARLDQGPGPPEDSQEATTLWSQETLSPLGDDEAAQAQAAAAASRNGGRAESNAFERIYRTFLGARAALAVVLTLSLGLGGVLQATPGALVTVITLVYALEALSLWLIPQSKEKFRNKGPGIAHLKGRNWLATVGLDIVCYLILHALTPTTFFNHVPLLVLPVLMAGVLTPRLMALATAAAVALGLLLVAWWSSNSSSDSTWLLSQAGLAASGLFVITVLAGELAGRIAREERSALGSLELARRQAQLNRLMIEEMQDGVLVVDRVGRVRAANPAARRLLSPSGLCPPAPFSLDSMPAWQSLVGAVEQAFSSGTWPEAGSDITLRFGPSSVRILRMRVRFTRREAVQAGEDFCLLFFEDVRSMQARSRQEKLAAMGRMSAGIAHEIRNPLAAISQANALLSEDAVTPTQVQLTGMVSENVQRLKRIIDDVLEAAPAGHKQAAVVDVVPLVSSTCAEWALSVGLDWGEDCALQLELPAFVCKASFDPEHLRRVLVNLLDNALRHGTRSPGSVRLRVSTPAAHSIEISVASDGAPIEADVESYLFEPFFSTRSRGTGLGLYICRELCERYGARIDFKLCSVDSSHRNKFVVDMPRLPEASQEATPCL